MTRHTSDTDRYIINKDRSVGMKRTSLFTALALLCRDEIKKVLNIDVLSANPIDLELVTSRFASNHTVDINGIVLDSLEGMDTDVLSVKYCVPSSVVVDVVARRYDQKYKIVDSMLYTKSQVERIFGCTQNKKRMVRLTNEIEGLYEKVGRFLIISGKDIIDNIDFFTFRGKSLVTSESNWVRFSFISKLIGKKYAMRASQGAEIMGVKVKIKKNEHGELRYRRGDVNLIKKRIGDTVPIAEVECWKGVDKRVKARVMDRLKIKTFDQRRINRNDIEKIEITTKLALREDDDDLVSLIGLSSCQNLSYTKRNIRSAIMRSAIPSLKIGRVHYVGAEYADVCKKFFLMKGRQYAKAYVFRKLVMDAGLEVLPYAKPQ